MAWIISLGELVAQVGIWSFLSLYLLWVAYLSLYGLSMVNTGSIT